MLIAMDAQNLSSQAKLLITSNDLHGANYIFIQLAKLMPNDTNIFMQLAWTHLKLGKIEDVITVYQEFPSLKPNLNSSAFWTGNGIRQTEQTQRLTNTYH